MKNKFTKKYKNVQVIKSTQGMAPLSLAVIEAKKRHRNSSTPRARALSFFGAFFRWSNKDEVYSHASSVPRARILSLLGYKLIYGVLAVAIVIAPISALTFASRAEAATSNQLNFQGRLLSSSGALIPDGNYHVELKLYNALSSAGSSQGSCAGDANCLWTETRTTGDLVTIQNGYYSVYLGDVTALPTIDWSQDLFLGMNIGGSAGAAAWDGEMTPRFKLTAVPYAFSSSNVASSETNAASTDSDAVSISTGNALGVTSGSGNLTLDVGTATGTSGIISLGSANASALNIGNSGAAFTLQGSQSSTLIADNGTFATTLSFTDPTANNAIVLPDESGTICTTGSICAGYQAAGTYATSLQSAYNGGNTILTSTGVGDLAVTVADATNFSVDISGTGSFLVEDNGVVNPLFEVNSTGTTTFRNSVNSNDAFSILSSGGGRIVTVDSGQRTFGVGGVTPGSLAGALHVAPVGGDYSVGLHIETPATGTYEGNLFQIDNAAGDVALRIDAEDGSHDGALKIGSDGAVVSGNTLGTWLETGSTASANTTGRSGHLYLETGEGRGTNGGSGNINLDSGISNGAGVSGAIDIGSTNASAVNIGNSGAAFTLQGSQASTLIADNGTFATTLSFTSPTANNAIVLPDESGTICTTGSVCSGYQAAGTYATSLQSAYDGGSTILAADGIGDIDLTVSGATNFSVDITGTGGFIIQDGGASVFTVSDGGSSTFDGDLAVNSSALTTDEATFSLINSIATTVNFAGGATTLEIGAATGTTSINNDLTVDGTAYVESDSTTAFQIDKDGTTPILVVDTNTNTAGGTLAVGGGITNLTGSNEVLIVQGNVNPAVTHFSSSDTAAYGALYRAVRSRGTNASPTAVADNDQILNLQGVGYITGGSNFNTGAEIQFNVDGTPTATQLPAEILLRTRPAGGALTDRLSVRSSGEVEIYTLGAADTDTILCRNSNNAIATCSSGAATSLQSAYNGGNTILTSTGVGDLAVTVADATNFSVDISGTGSFLVEDNGVVNPLFEVNSTGTTTFRNSVNSNDAFSILNSGGNRIVTVDSTQRTFGVGGVTPGSLVGALHVSPSGGDYSVGLHLAIPTTGTYDGNIFQVADSNGDIALRIDADDGTHDGALKIGSDGAIVSGNTLGTWLETGSTASANATGRSGHLYLATGEGRGTNGGSGTVYIDSGESNGAGVSGAIDIGSTNASAVNIGNSGAAFTLQGSQASTLIADNGTFATTLSFANPTANNAIVLPDESGMICTTGSICTGYASSLQSAYNGGNTILAADGIGDIELIVSETTSFSVDITGTGSFLVQDSGTVALSVTETSLNLDQTTINIGDAIATSINIGSNISTTTVDGGNIYFTGNTAVLSGNSLTVQSGSTLLTGPGTGANALTINNHTGTGNIIEVQDAATAVFTVADGGATTFRNAADSTSAFSVVTSGASTLLNVDTANELLTVSGTVFNAATTQVFTASANITQANIDGSGTILISSDASGYTSTLSDPTTTTAGRLVYVTNVGTFDMTLGANGGGSGNTVTLKPNTSATMIWNGVDWTAAGASSSTDLQAAYNNTATSAGGAELILNASGGAADGLTIRNNSTTPIVGGILEVQSAIGTNLFSVNNIADEYVSNGGAENSSTFNSDWTQLTGSTRTRNTDISNLATGTGSVQVATTGVNGGVKNNLATSLSISTQYMVSFTAKTDSGTLANADLEVYYSRNGGPANAACTNTSTADIVSTEFTKFTCTIVTDGTGPSDADLLIRQTDATSRTIYIDNLSVTENSSSSEPDNVQIGGGINGGPITLFTLDRASAPPVENGNETYLGSMYYDTTSGRIQCYEADGWGACGSAPNNYVNLNPEYPGSVLNGTGVGTMTADFCADQSGILVVNDTFCDTGESKNYYNWTSPQATQQEYSIYVTYQLPAAFKAFDSNNTVTLTARTDSTTLASVTYEMFRNEADTITACGSETLVTTNADEWQTVPINGDEADGCDFTTDSADNFVIFKINMKARGNANAYASTLSFTSIGQ